MEESRAPLRDRLLNRITRRWRIPTGSCREAAAPGKPGRRLPFCKVGRSSLLLSLWGRCRATSREGMEQTGQNPGWFLPCPPWPCPTTLPKRAAVAPRGFPRPLSYMGFAIWVPTKISTSLSPQPPRCRLVCSGFISSLPGGNDGSGLITEHSTGPPLPGPAVNPKSILATSPACGVSGWDRATSYFFGASN